MPVGRPMIPKLNLPIGKADIDGWPDWVKQDFHQIRECYRSLNRGKVVYYFNEFKSLVHSREERKEDCHETYQKAYPKAAHGNDNAASCLNMLCPGLVEEAGYTNPTTTGKFFEAGIGYKLKQSGEGKILAGRLMNFLDAVP